MVELFVGWCDEDENKEAGEQQCAGGGAGHCLSLS